MCLCVVEVGKEFHRWDLQLGRYYSEVHTGLLYVVNDPRLFTSHAKTFLPIIVLVYIVYVVLNDRPHPLRRMLITVRC